MVHPREDVTATLWRRPSSSRRRGVEVDDARARGRPRRRDPRRRRGAAGRPDHRRQQGHDRRQALPARQRAEQGLPSRSLQRDDHQDYLRSCCASWRLRRRDRRGLQRRGRVDQAPAVAAVGARLAEVARGRLEARLDRGRARVRARARRGDDQRGGGGMCGVAIDVPSYLRGSPKVHAAPSRSAG